MQRDERLQVEENEGHENNQSGGEEEDMDMGTVISIAETSWIEFSSVSYSLPFGLQLKIVNCFL